MKTLTMSYPGETPASLDCYLLDCELKFGQNTGRTCLRSQRLPYLYPALFRWTGCGRLDTAGADRLGDRHEPRTRCRVAHRSGKDRLLRLLRRRSLSSCFRTSREESSQCNDSRIPGNFLRSRRPGKHDPAAPLRSERAHRRTGSHL